MAAMKLKTLVHIAIPVALLLALGAYWSPLRSIGEAPSWWSAVIVTGTPIAYALLSLALKNIQLAQHAVAIMALVLIAAVLGTVELALNGLHANSLGLMIFSAGLTLPLMFWAILGVIGLVMARDDAAHAGISDQQ